MTFNLNNLFKRIRNKEYQEASLDSSIPLSTEEQKELFQIDLDKEKHLLTENEQRFITAYLSDRNRNLLILILSLASKGGEGLKLKKDSLFSADVWQLCEESVDCVNGSLFLGTLFSSMDLGVFPQYHTVLIFCSFMVGLE